MAAHPMAADLLATKMSCENTINDNIFNRCLYRKPFDATVFVQEVQAWFNPVFVSQVTFVMLFLLPLLVFGKTLQANFSQRWHFYRLLKLKLLNFLHRMTYTLVLDVALYCVFRQRRPCICDGAQIGSIYGMPSGDAMGGALLGAFLIDEGPVFPLLSRVFGALIIFCTCLERTMLGYHSLGQVITGASLGVLLHFYSTRAPQFMVYLDALVTVLLGFIALFADGHLHFTENDGNNIFAWFVNGCAYVLFVVVMHLWHFWKHEGLGNLRRSVRSLTSEQAASVETGFYSSLKVTPAADFFQDVEEVTPLKAGAADDEFPSRELHTLIVALILFAVITTVSLAITRYNWFSPLA